MFGVAKDRAAPFSRKHRIYWIPVTGGMVLIGLINVFLGMCGYEEPSGPPQKIELVLPPPTYVPDAHPAEPPAPDAGSAAAATPR